MTSAGRGIAELLSSRHRCVTSSTKTDQSGYSCACLLGQLWDQYCQTYSNRLLTFRLRPECLVTDWFLSAVVTAAPVSLILNLPCDFPFVTG